MEIDYLGRDPVLILTVATWIFNAFHSHNPHSSVEVLSSRLIPHVESREMPLTLVAFDSKKTPVGTASLIETETPHE
jgi:hypothetical protein